MVSLNLHFNGAWRKMPEGIRVTNEVLWHYTTASGVDGILRSNSFWASSAAMLNDSSEVEYGCGLLQNFWREFKSDNKLYDTWVIESVDLAVNKVLEQFRWDEVFVLCASRHKDDLSQWRGYAEGSGYAISLKIVDSHRTPLRILAGKDEPAIGAALTSAPEWTWVLYKVEEQEELLRRMVEYVCDFIGSLADASAVGEAILETAA
ncbi:MAG: hypothetical protein QOD39_3186, partial [Mycobacterium sp.]|nr:hypothetical protein [Mycobacterium sp.]